MNAKRREKLRETLNLIGRTIAIVENVSDQETDAMDNCPENLQYTDRYEAMEDAVENLGEATDKLEAAKNYIESAIG